MNKYSACVLVCGVLFVLLFGLLWLGVDALTKWYEDRTTLCAFCGERFFYEGSELDGNWYCDRCWSQFELFASCYYGDKYCASRIDTIRRYIVYNHGAK